LGLLIEFKCSYKFIPISLKNVNYELGEKKIFPYDFVNENNLNYIGEVPDKKFFNQNISQNDYDNYLKLTNNLFNLKKETISYCENDVKITYNLIVKIIQVMDKKYLKLFKKSYSCPSLSYKIFFKY
jgi:hypothetical protein